MGGIRAPISGFAATGRVVTGWLLHDLVGAPVVRVSVSSRSTKSHLENDFSGGEGGIEPPISLPVRQISNPTAGFTGRERLRLRRNEMHAPQWFRAVLQSVSITRIPGQQTSSDLDWI